VRRIWFNFNNLRIISGCSFIDTLLKLIDYGDDDDDDDIDVTDNIPKGNPTPGSEQKPFWAV
jgi:hypothetical protein